MRTLLGKLPPLLCALIATGAAAQVSAPGATRPNHLKGSKSSYLLRASQQPIDWYPWGEEAFRKAKDLDRPILLDLGAEWCPYCARMDRESYELPELAKFINNHFVSIKVDYDMQPEIAARLQRAQAYMNLPAGLPLTAFLSPSGKLYFGDGYFPAVRIGRSVVALLIRQPGIPEFRIQFMLNASETFMRLASLIQWTEQFVGAFMAASKS